MAPPLLPGLNENDIVLAAPDGRAGGKELILEVIGSVLGNEKPLTLDVEEEQLPFWVQEAVRWEVVEAASPEHGIENDSGATKYQRVLISDLGPRAILRDVARANARVLVLLRDPVDFRTEKAKEMLAKQPSHDQGGNPNIDSVVCEQLAEEITRGQQGGVAPPLERQIVRWYKASTRGFVKFVFYEQLLAEPSSVFQELARYLDVFSTQEHAEDETHNILLRVQESEDLKFGIGYIHCSESTIASVKDVWSRRVAKRLPEALTYSSFYETLLSRDFPFMPSTFELDKAPKLSRAKSLKWLSDLGRRVKSSVIQRAPAWAKLDHPSSASAHEIRPQSTVSIVTRKFSFQSSFSDNSSVSNMSHRSRQSRFGRFSVERRYRGGRNSAHRRTPTNRSKVLRFTEGYDENLNRIDDYPLSLNVDDILLEEKQLPEGPNTAPARTDAASFQYDNDEEPISMDAIPPAPPVLSEGEEDDDEQVPEEAEHGSGTEEEEDISHSDDSRSSVEEPAQGDSEEEEEARRSDGESEEDKEESHTEEIDPHESLMRKYENAKRIYEHETVYEPPKSVPLLPVSPPPPSSPPPEHEPEYNPLQPIGIVASPSNQNEEEKREQHQHRKKGHRRSHSIEEANQNEEEKREQHQHRKKGHRRSHSIEEAKSVTASDDSPQIGAAMVISEETEMKTHRHHKKKKKSHRKHAASETSKASRKHSEKSNREEIESKSVNEDDELVDHDGSSSNSTEEQVWEDEGGAPSDVESDADSLADASSLETDTDASKKSKKSHKKKKKKKKKKSKKKHKHRHHKRHHHHHAESDDEAPEVSSVEDYEIDVSNITTTEEVEKLTKELTEALLRKSPLSIASAEEYDLV